MNNFEAGVLSGIAIQCHEAPGTKEDLTQFGSENQVLCSTSPSSPDIAYYVKHRRFQQYHSNDDGCFSDLQCETENKLCLPSIKSGYSCQCKAGYDKFFETGLCTKNPSELVI